MQKGNGVNPPCYLCNLPVSFTKTNVECTNYYAKICYLKCSDRSIKSTVHHEKKVSDEQPSETSDDAEPTITDFDSIPLDQVSEEM